MIRSAVSFALSMFRFVWTVGRRMWRGKAPLGCHGSHTALPRFRYPAVGESINDSDELKAVTPSEERHNQKARYAWTYAAVGMVIGASAFALLLERIFGRAERQSLLGCLACWVAVGWWWLVASRRERRGDDFRCDGVLNNVCNSPAVF